jgi:hypothetical protein
MCRSCLHPLHAHAHTHTHAYFRTVSLERLSSWKSSSYYAYHGERTSVTFSHVDEGQSPSSTWASVQLLISQEWKLWFTLFFFTEYPKGEKFHMTVPQFCSYIWRQHVIRHLLQIVPVAWIRNSRRCSIWKVWYQGHNIQELIQIRGTLENHVKIYCQHFSSIFAFVEFNFFKACFNYVTTSVV